MKIDLNNLTNKEKEPEYTFVHDKNYDPFKETTWDKISPFLALFWFIPLIIIVSLFLNANQ